MDAIVSPESPPVATPGRARRGRGHDAALAEPHGQRDPRALDGRGAAGELRPPGHADGHGRDRGRAVGPASAPQPGQSALARPRPLRAVERPRLDAAVFAAAPDRLRPRALGAAQLPPAAQPDARPSRVRDHARRRDDDRPARPGPHQRGRHGARGKAPRRRVQPRRPRRSSTITPTSSSATAA